MINISESNKLVSFKKSEFLEKGDAFKQKFSAALRQGFFYMEIPEEIKQGLNSAISFAEELREQQEKLKSFDLGVQAGYQVRKGTQVVAFVAKKEDWQKVHSTEVQSVALKMNDLALELLKEALQCLDIPIDQWEKATGGLTHGKGSNYFTVNNYKPGPEKIGLIPHHDWGWITVLFINQIGLEAMVDNVWTDIPPKNNYFVINFGKAFDTLIDDKTKLNASLHRVRHLFEKRISFGLFINHDENSSVYQLKKGNLIEKQSYREFITERFAEVEALQEDYSKSHS